MNEDTQLNECMISDKKKAELEQICLKTLDIFQARGWLRVDLMQDKDQSFYVLEVNTVPGMTSHSLFPKSAESIGISYDELVNKFLMLKIRFLLFIFIINIFFGCSNTSNQKTVVFLKILNF